MLLDLCECKYEHGRLWWKTCDKVLQGYPSEIWPITCQTMEGHLQQSDVYNARDDCPRLGSRLIKPQQFKSCRRSGKLTDLWRDRRNRLQWYTFWAVVLVGGMATSWQHSSFWSLLFNCKPHCRKLPILELLALFGFGKSFVAAILLADYGVRDRIRNYLSPVKRKRFFATF